MLSEETIERYRRMTVSERGAIVLRMMQERLDRVAGKPPEVVERWTAWVTLENDERNRRMLEGMARSGRADEKEPGSGGIDGQAVPDVSIQEIPRG